MFLRILFAVIKQRAMAYFAERYDALRFLGEKNTLSLQRLPLPQLISPTMVNLRQWHQNILFLDNKLHAELK